MKDNALGIIGLVAVSIVALGGIAALSWEKRSPNQHVTFLEGVTHGGTSGKHGIILQLKDADWDKIAGVLNDDRKVFAGADDRTKLYHVRHFTSGTADGDAQGLGHLDPKLLYVDENKISVPQDFTGYAFQIGVGGEESYQKIPAKGIPNMPQGHGKLNMRESKEMVDEINDILNPGQ